MPSLSNLTNFKEVIYAWAVTYTQAGWCVVPAKNKRPVIKWKEYSHGKERPSVKQVQEWFSSGQNNEVFQIALVTGEVSRVTVIDIDAHKEGSDTKNPTVEGHTVGDTKISPTCTCLPESVEKIAFEKVGATMMSKTGGGGIHMFCKYEEGLGNSVKLAHPQMDIRSDGGIIILPPSLHENGRLYEWNSLFPWNGGNLKNLISFPQDLKKDLREKPKADWKEIVKGVENGKRNISTASLAGKLIGCFGMDYLGVAWELLEMWNKRNNPPVNEYELRRTFESIVTKHYDHWE